MVEEAMPPIAIVVAKQLVAGTAAGFSECISSYPLDTVKVRMQTAAEGAAGFNGPLDCLLRTAREDGALALYRGMSSRMVSCMVSSSLMFGCNGGLKRFFGAEPHDPKSVRFMAAAACTGAVEALIYTPLELVKSRMQVERGAVISMTPLSCARSIFAEKGLVDGLFHGFAPTVARESLGNLVYFCTYEYAVQGLPAAWRLAGLPGYRRHEVVKDPREDHFNVGVAGGCAGMAFWASIFPVDTIKSLMQTDSVNSPRYSSTLDCVRQVLATRGPLGFYRGLGPSLLRAFVGNGAQFIAFERVMRLLSDAFPATSSAPAAG